MVSWRNGEEDTILLFRFCEISRKGIGADMVRRENQVKSTIF